ncbi:MAG TPA: hypothetical protein VKE22_01050 [Haliangiales bacterium]|nr:hypothetical protein [Haliangiales bacterium]
MPRPERVAGFADVIALLEADGVPHTRHDAQKIVELATDSGPAKGAMLIRWETEVPYATVIHPIVMNVAPERLAAMTECVTLLNHAILLPGFGVDRDQRFAYFRLVLPIEPAGMQADFFRTMVLACLNNSRDFWLALHGVANGEAPEGALRTALALLGQTKAPSTLWKDN